MCVYISAVFIVFKPILNHIMGLNTSLAASYQCLLSGYTSVVWHFLDKRLISPEVVNKQCIKLKLNLVFTY